MTRRIVLQLADDTTDNLCGSCPSRSRRGECDVFGPLHPSDDGDDLRHDACRSAELRPETVDVVRSELGYIVRNFREDDPNRIAWADALADFERLFGGGE